MEVILFSIPFFFLLLLAEVAYSARSGRALLRLNDSVADLSCGILSQLAGVASKLLTIGIYIWVAATLAVHHWVAGLPEWPSGAPFSGADAFPYLTVDAAALASWVAVFLLVDLCYYWSHRMAHQVNFLWAGHVVHHSSEEYNLAVALRQSSLHGFFSWIFYMPLALLGIPWQMYVVTYALNLVYQFWIHTRAVGKLGPLAEWILNTPSHHRVHHGRNPKYLDRNHGGALIVWDRLFGTFTPEEEEPVYGITTPLRSWNPLWANVHVFVEIARSARRAASWRDRLMYVVGPPGWRPEAEGGRVTVPEVDPATAEAYDPTISGGLRLYGLAQFVVATGAAFLLLLREGELSGLHLLAGGFYVAVALAGIGGVFEAAKWAGPLETARHVVFAGVCVVLGWAGALPVAVAAAGVGFCALSLAWLLPRRGELTETELAPLM
jgi:alkylglycerol monooxygenase